MNTLTMLVAISQRLQTSALIVGILGIFVGLFLMKGHQLLFERNLKSDSSFSLRQFETRKLRRRTIVAGLVTSIGFMLAAMYWVSEIKVLAIFTLLIVVQLFFVLGMALIDLFFVSVREITKPDQRRQKEIIEEFLRNRQQSRKDEK